MTILTMLLSWGAMFIVSLVATFIFNVRFSRPDEQEGSNQWRPAQCYDWEPKR
ncbi:hypothetical protein [Hoeflea sp.]|uniref:hypothetical protein n=1 Tax=Hoeflea sp. TaxID=1940281 RepID=UPI0025BFCEF7|nr:hypothetical protein [Hoeflea sp.]